MCRIVLCFPDEGVNVDQVIGYPGRDITEPVTLYRDDIRKEKERSCAETQHHIHVNQIPSSSKAAKFIRHVRE